MTRTRNSFRCCFCGVPVKCSETWDVLRAFVPWTRRNERGVLLIRRVCLSCTDCVPALDGYTARPTIHAKA